MGTTRLHGVEQQLLCRLDDRQHRLAAHARPAAEHCDRVGLEQLPGPPHEQLDPGPRVGSPGDHAAAENAARRVDPLQGVQFDVAQRRGADAQGPGLRVQQSERHLALPRRHAQRAADEHPRRQRPRRGERGGRAAAEGGAAADPRRFRAGAHSSFIRL
jgi:hypothetical protein